MPDAVIGDPTRLCQIVTNLVSNAVKFTGQGEVHVAVSCEPAETVDHSGAVVLHFVVSDTGIGIPAEKQASIFSAFVQADTSTTRRYGGTGLGLSISARFVEMMQGRIWVESRVNEGSRFHFTARFQNCASQPSKRPPDLSMRGLKVLVVDDNQANRTFLSQSVAAWGLVPSLAASGTEALKALAAANTAGVPFALMISDVKMPEMDGFTLARLLTDDPALTAVKILLLNSMSGRDDSERCRRLQVGAHLTKPVRQTELHAAIQSLVTDGPMPVPLAAAATVPASPNQTTRAKVLVAEDNPVNQRVIKGLLERQGFAARIVSNGLQAVEAIREQPFDLVLMDVQMPEMDGFEATAEIRRLETALGRRHNIVAMTANAMAGDRERCLNAGMDDYLSKPIDLARLSEILRPGHHLDVPAVLQN